MSQHLIKYPMKRRVRSMVFLESSRVGERGQDQTTEDGLGGKVSWKAASGGTRYQCNKLNWLVWEKNQTAFKVKVDWFNEGGTARHSPFYCVCSRRAFLFLGTEVGPAPHVYRADGSQKKSIQKNTRNALKWKVHMDVCQTESPGSWEWAAKDVWKMAIEQHPEWRNPWGDDGCTRYSAKVWVMSLRDRRTCRGYVRERVSKWGGNTQKGVLKCTTFVHLRMPFLCKLWIRQSHEEIVKAVLLKKWWGERDDWAKKCKCDLSRK